MKTLNKLLQEYNIQNIKEQPINESVLLICGLFGALMMGFAAIFNSCKDNWKDLPEVSDKDKEKADENINKMSKSTRASYNNFQAEMFNKGKNEEYSDEVKQLQIELKNAENDGSKQALKELKSQAKTIKKWIKKEKYKEGRNLHYFGIVWQKLAKYSEELNNDEGIELGQELYGLIKNRWPNVILDADDEEAFKVYFSQIGINFDYAWDNNGESFDTIGTFVSEAAENAKKRIESEQQNSSDNEQGDKFDKQTVCDYVFKIALALGPKDNLVFSNLLDPDEINSMSAIITLIGATMVVGNSKHSKDTLQMYQEMFNTLDLKISLTGK